MLNRRNRSQNAWKLLLSEKYASEPYIINTSPVVLGASGKCDIVIDDPTVSKSHIQFVLIDGGKYLEIYNLSDASEEGGGTRLNGESLEKQKIKAQHDKFFTLSAGNVRIRLIYAPIKSTSPADRTRVGRERKIRWYYLHDGEQHGPMEKSALLAEARKGGIRPLDDAWHSGQDYRIKAFEIPGLFDPIYALGGGHGILTEGNRKDDLNGTSAGTDFDAVDLSGNAGKYHASVSGETDNEENGTLRCPSCWYRFTTEELHYISRHPDLMGDPVLGSEALLRFLPREFKPVRRVLDSRGEICTEMACPRCHLRIPTPFLDTTPIFLSIIGTPGSGKSYYLASSTWMLRKMLPRYFGITFEDVDNVTNQWLNTYEEALFFPVDGVEYHVIEKTQIEADGLSKQVKINDITLSLPQPAMFNLLSKEETSLSRTLAVYDNAGEHFQTGQDGIRKPGTLHMLHAHGYLFLFDPTADPRFGTAIDASIKDQIVQTVYQQQKILIETIDRIRKYTDLSITDRFEKPIVVGLSKVDVLMDHLKAKGLTLKGTPLKWLKKGEAAALDLDAVQQVSFHIRSLFFDLAPEYINTIEAFARKVIYLPVSAIGHQPDQRGVHKDHVHPLWVEVPFLYILSEMGLIPSA